MDMTTLEERSLKLAVDLGCPDADDGECPCPKCHRRATAILTLARQVAGEAARDMRDRAAEVSARRARAFLVGVEALPDGPVRRGIEERYVEAEGTAQEIALLAVDGALPLPSTGPTTETAADARSEVCRMVAGIAAKAGRHVTGKASKARAEAIQDTCGVILMNIHTIDRERSVSAPSTGEAGPVATGPMPVMLMEPGRYARPDGSTGTAPLPSGPCFKCGWLKSDHEYGMDGPCPKEATPAAPQVEGVGAMEQLRSLVRRIATLTVDESMPKETIVGFILGVRDAAASVLEDAHDLKVYKKAMAEPGPPVPFEPAAPPAVQAATCKTCLGGGKVWRWGEKVACDGGCEGTGVFPAQQPAVGQGGEREEWKLSDPRARKVLDRECPDCGGRLLDGPTGGLSINVKCSACDARFNDQGPFGAQRISHGKKQPHPSTGREAK